MQNFTRLNDAFDKSGANSIFPLIGLMKEGTVINITPVENPDPENVMDVYEELISEDQMFIYKQEEILANQKNWETDQELNKHILNFMKENNLSDDFQVAFLIPTEYGNLRYIVEKLNTTRFIDLRELPLIETPEQFFSTDKIAYIHITNLGLEKDMPKDFINDIKSTHKIIFYNNMFYALHFLKGSPENIYINFKEGSSNSTTFMRGEFDLNKAIEDKCLFDFSDENKKLTNGIVNLLNDDQYIINNFIVGKTHQEFDIIHFGK